MTESKTLDCAYDFVVGSGDYLRDRGYSNPAKLRAKFFLADQITAAIGDGDRSVPVPQAAHAPRFKPETMSRILNGNVGEISIWNLMEILTDLGCNVSIATERNPSGRGRISGFDITGGAEVVVLALRRPWSTRPATIGRKIDTSGVAVGPTLDRPGSGVSLSPSLQGHAWKSWIDLPVNRAGS